MSYGPFPTERDLTAWLESWRDTDDPLFFAIMVDGRAVGLASYLRIQPDAGVIEVGHLSFSPLLQRTTAATEAMALMLRHAFDGLGYRRVEWKADALNEKSARAARRLGFTFEGTFRQGLVYKGRNRDTAWFSIVDSEWPSLAAAFDAWLAPDNFDGHGRQRARLEELR